jgi:hypothetical protein
MTKTPRQTSNLIKNKAPASMLTWRPWFIYLDAAPNKNLCTVHSVLGMSENADFGKNYDFTLLATLFERKALQCYCWAD